MSRTFSPHFLCALAIMSIATMLPVYAQTQNRGANTALPEKPTQAKPGVGDVHSKSNVRAKVLDLQQNGFLTIPQRDDGGRGPVTLTPMTVAVILQRMGASIGIRTLTQDSTKLEVRFGFPGKLELKQAQEMLDLWTEFGPELKLLGVEPNRFQSVRKTMELYIAVSTPDTIKGADKPSGGKTVAPPSS